METIQESIKKMKELEKNIFEQGGIGAQSLKDVRAFLGDLADIKSTFKLAMDEVKMTKLLQMDVKNFEKEVKKAVQKDLKSGFPTGTIGTELKEISKIDTIRRITNEAKIKNRALRPAEIDAIKNQVKAENQLLTTKIKPTSTGTGASTGAGTPPPGTPPKTSKVVEILKKLPKNIKDGLLNLVRGKKTWKVIAKWALLAGVPLSVAWWFLKDSGEQLPGDFPDNTPQDFPPCVQDLIRNKQGVLKSLSTGGDVIFVKSNEYPNGIQFYPNGRVLDIKTGKKGTYKCKGEKVALEEQSSEIDVDTLSSYVNTAIDDLDGFVTTSNLTSLENILKALKGKTFQGKSALSEFLFLYKENEGSDFVSDVNSVGVRTLDPKASLIKRNVLGMLSGSSATTQTSSGDLGGIDITWDTKTSTGGGTSGGGTTKVQYKDKSDFPFPRGTRNEKIREVQKCLNFPAKLQTGNFGPITYKALVSFIKDSENYKFGLTGGFNIYVEELNSVGLTKDLYDIVMRACGKVSTTGDTTTTTGGQTTTGTVTTGGQTTTGTVTTGGQTTTGTVTTGGETTNETPQQLYNRFVKERFLVGRLNGRRIVYKGPDLTDGDRVKLESQLKSMGFRVSKENRDYKKGDKVVFKREVGEE